MQLPVILFKTEADPHMYPSYVKLPIFFNVICYKKMQIITQLPKIKLLPISRKLTMVDPRNWVSIHVFIIN